MYKEWKVKIPTLTGDEKRKAYIYVPDSYYADRSRRYPVLYMFDGQNLFRDTEATYGKSWGILDYFTRHDVPLIVAALECNHHAEDEPCGGRLSEYSPFDFSNRYFGTIKGRGALTMDYLTKEFKPYVDSRYPTLPDRDHTFIAGSSMGGLMTAYALLAYGDVFSRGAALSPSFLFCPVQMKELIKNSDPCGTVLYTDMGTAELDSARHRKVFGDICALLVRKGMWVESRIVPGGEHNEASWEKQIPFFLNTLLYGLDEEKEEPDER